jgi:chromosome segregation protein
MHLKRLEIHGFKTFASRTAFAFQPGITAVVGPNGSGKSNVVDSIRWVLGEQSYAALRSKRTEDLIFGGGGRRAPAGFAEVSLTIDNSDRLLPLPYGEVTIARRATRAGENEYFINRTKVRLRDIQEAVGPLGGSYTVINQGLVDQALNLRPEDRRRLFEDAAEIGVFESRRAETERRLRETNANVERVADLLAELEPRMRSLKRQASLARSYRELSAELRVLLARHYAALWTTTRSARQDAELAEQQLAAVLNQRRATLAAAVEELREGRERLRAIRTDLAALHNESSALHAQAETAQRDLAVGGERQAALALAGEELERAARELALRYEELEREQTETGARLAAAEQRARDQRTLVAVQEGALAAGEAEQRAARQTLDAAQRAELAAQAALAEHRRRAEQLAARRERTAQEQLAAAQALTAAEQTQSRTRAAAEHAQALMHATLEAAQHAAATTDSARADVEVARSRRARADEVAAQARRTLADAEARLESLARLQRSFAGTFAGVKAAMQWADSERRTGFALVSTLVRAPEQIETAIEVALGARLQHIVVEQWADAEDAIEALKRSGAGRATFLPLDTIRRNTPDDRRPTREDGVLGIAAELVEFDAHYHDVIWYLLGRTLVVEELAAARRVLRGVSGSWSLVTLAGEQVSSGGAVTGGAQVKETGTLRRERELRALPGQVEKLRSEAATAAAERAQLEQSIAAAERAVQEAEAARRRAAQELEARRALADQARRAADHSEADLALQRRRHEQISADLADTDAQINGLAAEQTGLQARETEAHRRLTLLRDEAEARAAADRRAAERLTTLRSAAAAADGEARAERALLQSAAQQLARLDEQRAAGSRRAADLARDRTVLEAANQALAERHSALLSQIDELRAQISPSEAELAELEATLAEIEQRETTATAALLEAETAHTRATLELQRARDRIDTLWERAAADDIDVEALGEQATRDTQREIAADAPQPQEDVQEQIAALRGRIQRLGVVNPLALEEYEEAFGRHEFLSSQTDDLRRAAGSLTELIAELDASMRARFETTFEAVAAEFGKSFTRLFGGGHAQLLLVKEEPSTNGGANGHSHERVEGLGIEILVRPPGKRQQTLALLSGGERSLTAAALLFAILKVNPSPFCVLDEVDAALDETNVGRFREALADLTAQTQFLVVTHNRGTIEVADTIYGVSMGEDGASKVLSLRLEEMDVER